jgi:coproporphyrinogen III oxidase-like Fe-S oxidoreductase
VKRPETYLKHAGRPESLGGVNTAGAQDLVFEYMLNRSRLMQDFAEAEFEAATGLARSLLAPGLARARALGLMDATATGWRITTRGHAYLNDLQSVFLPVAAET